MHNTQEWERDPYDLKEYKIPRYIPVERLRRKVTRPQVLQLKETSWKERVGTHAAILAVVVASLVAGNLNAPSHARAFDDSPNFLQEWLSPPQKPFPSISEAPPEILAAQRSPTGEAPQSLEAKAAQVKFAEEDKKQLNNILTLYPHTKERQAAEENYFLKVTELSKTNIPPSELLKFIDNGFQALTENNLRAYLLDIRYKLRQEGSPNLKKLTQEEINWSISEEIHPEVLGIAIDARRELLNDLRPFYEKDRDKFMSLFREDIVYKVKQGQLSQDQYRTIDLNQLFMNPGAMAKLSCTETRFKVSNPQFTVGGQQFKFTFDNLDYAFVQLGEKPALEQLKGPYKDSGEKLTRYINWINSLGDLHFDPNKILGSVPRDASVKGLALWVLSGGEGDVSGGAIGPVQMMPPTIEFETAFLDKNFAIKLNVLSVKDAVKLALAKTAHGVKVTYTDEVGKGKEGVRYAWLNGNLITQINGETKNLALAMQRDAVTGWNASLDQGNKIIAAGGSYVQTFGRNY